MNRAFLLVVPLLWGLTAGPVSAQSDTGSAPSHQRATEGPTLSNSASVLGGYGWIGGPRGANEAVTTNWLMSTATWSGPARRLTLRLMGSLEPIQGAEGYPLLLQTGETADGVVPLRDRQHPHDAIMEAAISVSGDTDGLGWEGYAALVGSPELGPEAFMHRAAARAIASAPISHHFLDATHISHGVLSAAVTLEGRVRLAASAFNGHEPDEDRWNVQSPSLNSFAFGLDFEVVPGWSIGTTFGSLESPEQLHPQIDVRRLTAQVTHARETSVGMLSLLGAVGRNQRTRLVMSVAEARQQLSAPIFEHYTVAGGVSTLPPGVSEEDVFLLFPARIQRAWLSEVSLTTPSRAAAIRIEHAAKDELFDPNDARHSQVFGVTKLEVGASQQLFNLGPFRFDVGGSLAVHRVPSELEATYGSGSPTSSFLFARLRLGEGHHP